MPRISLEDLGEIRFRRYYLNPISAWNWRTGQRNFQIPIKKMPATALTFSEASSLLVVNYGESQTVYDVHTQAAMYELKSGSSYSH